MYRNYLKIGFRNLLRNKGYSFINIGGLSVGMAVAMLIGLWINDELLYDQYHDNYHRIAQVMQHQSYNKDIGTHQVIPFPLGNELSSKYGSDFKYVVMATWLGDHILSFEEKSLIKKGKYMDVDAPRMLSLKMLKGNLEGLNEPGSILLSESTAGTFFGEEDPIGKLMMIDNELSVAVSGIYEDLPFNSRFRELLFIAPWELYVSSYDWVKRDRDNPNWDDNSYLLYTQIADHADMLQVSEKIKKVKYNNLNDSQKSRNSKIFLHPMADWHLKSNWINGIKSGGFIQYIWLFGIVGTFVLILACINFMNLSTAHSEKRSKEVGIRKSVGSTRIQLMSQFLTESFLVVTLAFALSMTLVFMIIPLFNQLADKQIFFPFTSWSFWLVSIGFILVTGFLAGSYPAIYLSSFRPAKVLKGSFPADKQATRFRKALVVLQFTVSVILIIGTMVVEKQIQHSKDRPVGYDKEGIIMIEITTADYENKYDLLRNELIKQNAILDMAVSSSPLTEVWNTNDGFHWKGKDPNLSSDFATIYISHEFGNTVGWEVVEGRDFSREFATDAKAYIVNEAAIKYMGMENPIGQTIRWGKEHEIIGVVKDMLMGSPFKPVKQTIYIIDNVVNVNWIVLKLNPDKDLPNALAGVENVFSKYIPAVPFEFKFADDEYAGKFAAEERVRQLSGIFAILAIFISCLGLFGLASFMAEQRTKEIGIRKVLGASVFNQWKMLSMEFVRLVIFSCVIAIPIAYYALMSWLGNYEYSTTLQWWIFVIAISGTLVITLLTVSYQVIKASLMNPVSSLRSE